MSNTLDRVRSEENALLLRSIVQSIAIATVAALAVWAATFNKLPRPQTPELPLPVLEAELVEQRQAKLYEKSEASPQKAEVSVGRSGGHATTPAETTNQTVASAPPSQLTRGPQVESSPAPKIPGYLKNQNLKTNVLIEFRISLNGDSTPELIGTSGNEELDALALSAARKWVFRPALSNGRPIDAKVRLRINFEVE